MQNGSEQGMGIRRCALESSAFLEMKEYYDDREKAARGWRAGGKKVVAQLGADVPDEFIIAAGMLPVRVYADGKGQMPEADRYLEYAFDPMMRAKFEKIVDGTYGEAADALAISNSTDVIIRLYFYLRELHRIEPERKIPDFAFIDWLFTRNRLHQERNEFVLGRFCKETERWAGHPVADDEIINAARLCNRDRDALRRIGELRHGREIHITGSEALVIIGSAFFMERGRHAELTEKLVQEAAGWPAADGIRVFYTGSVQEDTVLYEMLEDCGCVIVGEDHDWGDRFYNRNFRTEYGPIRGAADCYMLREFSSKKAFVSQRVEALGREVELTGAQAVLFYNHVYEEAASWDYPEQKKDLESRGIKTACYSKMQWPCSRNPDLSQRFAEMAAVWGRG